MSDHYHYASEVSGVATAGHSHSLRDLGAADDHDLDMLSRQVQSLQGDVAEAERKIAQLEAATVELQETLSRHMDNFVTLGEQVLELAQHAFPL